MSHSINTIAERVKLKIVLLGNQSVGKSSIIQKYVNDNFDQYPNPTVGIDFLAKNIQFKENNFRLQIWDTAGQQRFRSMIPSYLKDAHCALLIYDVTNANSLSNVEQWFKIYTDNKRGDRFAILVGNKIDLNYRQVQFQQGNKKAQQLGLPYFQTSAKTAQNLDILFNTVIEGCTQKNIELSKLGMKQRILKQNEKIITEQLEEQRQKSKFEEKVEQMEEKGQIDINEIIEKVAKVERNIRLKNHDNKGKRVSSCC